jgi:hypothetical protein
MNPFESARILHRSIPDIILFEEALSAHLLFGVVVSTPNVFFMARPVDSGADTLGYDDPWLTYDDPDTWHIYLAAGDLSTISDLLPYPLPWVSFVRKNSLRFRNSKHMQNLLHYGRQTEKTANTRNATGYPVDAGAKRCTES